MALISVGLDHEHASLDLLERATVPEHEWAKMLRTLVSHRNIHEAVFLSTCLRTEVVAVIDPANAQKFLDQIHKYERVRRRDGATSWGVFSDTETPDTYLESFKVDSWAEHERQHDRFTVADREIEKQVLSYAIKPVEVKHYIYAQVSPRP